MFDVYAQRLSDVFKQAGASLNFMLVGACDGTHDKTIRDRFLTNANWEGVFVEPVGVNYRDLLSFLGEKNVTHRSIAIRGDHRPSPS
jgi:hypothetical protein